MSQNFYNYFETLNNLEESLHIEYMNPENEKYKELVDYVIGSITKEYDLSRTNVEVKVEVEGNKLKIRITESLDLMDIFEDDHRFGLTSSLFDEEKNYDEGYTDFILNADKYAQELTENVEAFYIDSEYGPLEFNTGDFSYQADCIKVDVDFFPPFNEPTVREYYTKASYDEPGSSEAEPLRDDYSEIITAEYIIKEL